MFCAVAPHLTIAIDTGGTFTDCVYRIGNRIDVLKLPSTPDDPSRAILEAVSRICKLVPAATVEVRHGTTVATNALLERKGARVAFVTTAGFEDTLAIARQTRPDLYDWNHHRPAPITDLCFGVPERIGPNGEILLVPTPAALDQLRSNIRKSKAEAIAISLLFSFANPAHEQAVAQALASLRLPISLSHQILPEFREYERGSTVTLNAYLAPRLQNYIESLERGLARRSATLSIMQSSGGILSAASAAREPVRTILSGPAGGVIGALSVARAAGVDRILTFDMGGTSTDVALLDATREPPTSTEGQVAGLPVGVPMLDIHTAGAGGGSLAWMDTAGALCGSVRNPLEPFPALPAMVAATAPPLPTPTSPLAACTPTTSSLAPYVSTNLAQIKRSPQSQQDPSPASNISLKASSASPTPAWNQPFAACPSSAVTIRAPSRCSHSAELGRSMRAPSRRPWASAAFSFPPLPARSPHWASSMLTFVANSRAPSCSRPAHRKSHRYFAISKPRAAPLSPPRACVQY